MGTVKALYSSWAATLSLLLLVLFYWASYVWPPASYWYELHSVEVLDAKVGAPVEMFVRRDIHHDFIGYFHVIVRRSTDDGWVVVCNGTGGGDYRQDAVLPLPLTLDWWTNGACPTLTVPGHYVISTVITALPGAHLRRTIFKESNVFEVRP